MNSSPATRHTLIQRACDPTDERAWGEFVEGYRAFIFHVLHKVGVDHDDVEDLTQQILVDLTSDLHGYDRGRGKFRTWLSVVIRHRAMAYLQRQCYRSGRLKVLTELQDTEWDSSQQVTELDAQIQREWAAHVAGLAMDRVRPAFQGQAMEAFELYLDGLSANEISERTGLTISSVYTLRKRVKKRLYQAIRAVTGELEPSSPRT